MPAPPNRSPKPLSQRDLPIPTHHIHQPPHPLRRNPPIPRAARQLHTRNPQRRDRRPAKEMNKLALIILNHALQHHEVRRREFVAGGVANSRKGAPVMVVGEGVLDFGFFVVAQAQGREAGAQTRHALVVALLGYEWPVGLFAGPAQPGFSRGGDFWAVDTEEDGADEVEFGEEDVDEAEAVPAEFADGEDVAGDYADGVRGFGGDAGFVDELGEDGFGEDVEEVEEEGRAGCGLWEGVWWVGEEGRDGDGGLGGRGGFFEDGEDGLQLEVGG